MARASARRSPRLTAAASAGTSIDRSPMPPCLTRAEGGSVVSWDRRLADFDQVGDQPVTLALLHVGDVAAVPLPVLRAERDVVLVDIGDGAGTPPPFSDGEDLPELSQSDACHWLTPHYWGIAP